MIAIVAACYIVNPREMSDFEGCVPKVVGHEIAQDGTEWHVLEALQVSLERLPKTN